MGWMGYLDDSLYCSYCKQFSWAGLESDQINLLNIIFHSPPLWLMYQKLVRFVEY